ncbi:hypothetical protein SBRCBS47491_001330 [Sporothrix bragantina]|uniref:Uncharacterized protein n=1 Tax=Sporothrix bragantina TaxID=671064 RepID=A0ABP0AXW1_9PEZI
MAALPVESSWRMVDGEHDSFDTSIVPIAFGLGSDDGDEDPFISSSGAPSQQSATGPGARSSGGRLGLGTRTVSSASRGGASSSQEDHISLGEESFSGSIGGASAGGGSFGGSQDDDIHSFLRKAENDERVLLRSPFQPSLPSSVRQSPLSVMSNASRTVNKGTESTSSNHNNSRLDRQSYQTPEPEFRMPTIGMDGSLHTDAAGLPLGQRLPGISSAFHVSDTGSPALRRRREWTNKRSNKRHGQAESESMDSAPTRTSTAAWAGRLLVLLPLLSLAVAYGVPLLAQDLVSTTVGTVCSLPGIPQVSLSFCPPSATSNTPPSFPLQDSDDVTDASQEADRQEAETGNYWGIRNRFNYDKQQAEAVEDPVAPLSPVVNLARSVGDLMRAQTQLAAIVRQHILGNRGSGRTDSGGPAIPPAQDSWLVPRAQTKNLRMAAQMQQSKAQQKNTATLLVVELDAYLESAKHVSIALTRLQTGAAAVAADTLAYRSRQTQAQLRRMAAAVSRTQDNASGESDGWLARMFSGSSSANASAGRRRASLLETYRHHTDAVLSKLQLRVDEAEAVLKALEGTNGHLTGVQSYVTTRRDELVGASAFKTQPESPNSLKSIGSSTGGGPGGDPMLDTSGGVFSWLWSVLFGSSHEITPSTPSGTGKISQAAQTWSGYANTLQHLREDHDAAVTRAVDTLDELAAVRDTLRDLQLQFSDGSEGDSTRVARDDGDLDLWLHMDIVDAGIHDLEKAGR